MNAIRDFAGRSLRVALPAIVGMALVGCGVAQRASRSEQTAADAEAVQARTAALSAIPSWSFQGRLAVSAGNDGGSGRIEWSQDGPNYVVSVRTPVSNQTWRLSGDASQCVLEGVPGGPVRGTDPAELLRREIGWRLPVEAVAAWVRALPQDPARAMVRTDAEGLPQRLVEDGWTVTYRDYVAASEGAPPMPLRVQARRGDDEVRLAVTRWTLRGR